MSTNSYLSAVGAKETESWTSVAPFTLPKPISYLNKHRLQFALTILYVSFSYLLIFDSTSSNPCHDTNRDPGNVTQFSAYRKVVTLPNNSATSARMLSCPC